MSLQIVRITKQAARFAVPPFDISWSSRRCTFIVNFETFLKAATFVKYTQQAMAKKPGSHGTSLKAADEVA